MTVLNFMLREKMPCKNPILNKVLKNVYFRLSHKAHITS
jgi:hypothetical protein